jgi:hypothetical protein
MDLARYPLLLGKVENVNRAGTGTSKGPAEQQNHGYRIIYPAVAALANTPASPMIL